MLKEAGLPPLSWYDVLLELSRDPDSGLRQFEIGERVLLNKYNLSRLIDRLESNELVKRQACDMDGRGNIVKITKKGMQLKQAMWPVYAKTIQALVGEPLTTTQLRSLTEIVNTARKTYHQIEIFTDLLRWAIKATPNQRKVDSREKAGHRTRTQGHH
jgi:DNA-binding MarR family transcriptional regulator